MRCIWNWTAKVLSPDQTRMRVDESWLSSPIINSGQTRTRVVKSSSRVISNEIKLSLTFMKNLSTFKVEESVWESMRVHKSFTPNESESLNSHPRLARALPSKQMARNLTEQWLPGQTSGGEGLCTLVSRRDLKPCTPTPPPPPPPPTLKI